MANTKNNATSQETRRRLLEAAGEVFAERGVQAATIKQVTDRAGTNIAAVNYHFGDKSSLYAAVVRHALDLAQSSFARTTLVGSPERRLRGYLAALLRDSSDRSRPPWAVTILAHEFAQPTAALDAVIDELIRPEVDLLVGLIRQIVGRGVPERQVLQAAMSIGAQCFVCLYQRELIRRFMPQLPDGDGATAANHIATFSLAGLRGMRRRRRRTRRPALVPGVL